MSRDLFLDTHAADDPPPRMHPTTREEARVSAQEAFPDRPLCPACDCVTVRVAEAAGGVLVSPARWECPLCGTVVPEANKPEGAEGGGDA